MSGCIPTDSVVTCTCGYIHTDVNNPCYKNHELLLENIDILKKELAELKDCYFHQEKQIKALTDMYKDISIKVAACADHKIRQIDENRKISSRVDELENHVKNMTEAYIKKIIQNVKPHVCPVCEGNGKFWHEKCVSAQCHACEGKGIIFC